jgi:hypothetical protein
MRPLFILISLALFCLACRMAPAQPSNNSSGESPLYVVSTDPSDGALGVALSQCAPNAGFCGALITMFFSAPVTLDSLKVQTTPFVGGFLRCDLTPPFEQGCFSPNLLTSFGTPVDQSTRVVRLVSPQNFQADTEYKVSILQVGADMQQIKTWTFTTAPN